MFFWFLDSEIFKRIKLSYQNSKGLISFYLFSLNKVKKTEKKKLNHKHDTITTFNTKQPYAMLNIII